MTSALRARSAMHCMHTKYSLNALAEYPCLNAK